MTATALIPRARQASATSIELLATGVSLNQADEVGRSAFNAACGAGHWEIARVLMQAGAVLDSADTTGWRPIHGAAASGDLDLVKQLAEAGVDLSGAVDEAATGGQVHVVRWLVEEAGADIDESVDGDDLTPLINAAEAGQAEVVWELIRLGADRDQTLEGKSIADLAAGMGHESLAAELRGERLEPRLAWMKWFNEDSEEARKIGAGSNWVAHIGRIQQSYNAHLKRLLPALPRDLRCLPEANGRLNLHDAKVLLVQSDPEQQRVIVDLESYHETGAHEVLRSRIIYIGAEIVAPGNEELRRFRWDPPCVSDGELDFADGGRFEHRIQLVSDDPTLVIRFADAAVRIAKFVDDGIDLAPTPEFYEADT